MTQEQAGNISAAELEKYVASADFPADKHKLLDHARDKGAPQKILDLMSKVPDKEYDTVADLSVGISEATH